MAEVKIDLGQISRVAGMRLQMLSGARELARALGTRHPYPAGYAYQVCSAWQERFETAFQTPIPRWRGLVGFRSGIDWNIGDAFLEKLSVAAHAKHVQYLGAPPKLLETFVQCWAAVVAYLEQRQDIHSGKFTLADPTLQQWFVDHIHECEPTLGGQAGNIVQVWLGVGAEAVLYAPYLSNTLRNVANANSTRADLSILHIENEQIEIQSLRATTDSDEPTPIPTLSSWTAVANGRRLVFSLPAPRVLGQLPADSVNPTRLQFFYQSHSLLDSPLHSPGDAGGWVSLPFFCEPQFDRNTGQLNVTLTPPEQLATALKGRVHFVVVGGIESLFNDPWLVQEPALQARLLNVLEQQLGAIHAVGIRIGIELSGIPHRTYAEFIRRLSQDRVLQVIGINGVDELPRVVGNASLDAQLFDLWLDPQKLGASLETLRQHHADYLTYCQARKLAEWTGISTLYVHTLGLDFILKRSSEPGALAHAQMGDMMSKGLVIATLLERAYGSEWNKQLKYLPPAIKPSAMAQLAHFANAFETFERVDGASSQLLEQGYWLATSTDAYSLAVVPVMWPSVGEDSNSLPERLNPTGAGDMTFGAFFLLGGV